MNISSISNAIKHKNQDYDRTIQEPFSEPM